MSKSWEFLKEHSGKIQASLSMLVRLALFLSMAHAIYFHLWQILFADFFLLILLFMPYFLKKSYEIHIPKEFKIILLLFVLITFFLGFYSGTVIQIFFGIFVGFAGFAVMLILFSNSSLRTNYFIIILVSFSFAVTLGLSLEMLKFYLKIYLGYSFSAFDYAYAMISLSFVAAGALFSSLVGYSYMKGHRWNLLRIMVQKFKSTNPNYFVDKTNSPEEVLNIIKRGENEKTEFKSTFRTNLETKENDKKVENASLKTIIAFMNSEGGTLLIGVSDSKELLGIENDNFENNDKFLRHFMNLIKERIGNEFLPYIKSELIQIEGKNIFKVSAMKSDKPVFLKYDGVEEFYARIGASTLQITGSKLINYIENKFKTN